MTRSQTRGMRSEVSWQVRMTSHRQCQFTDDGWDVHSNRTRFWYCSLADTAGGRWHTSACSFHALKIWYIYPSWLIQSLLILLHYTTLTCLFYLSCRLSLDSFSLRPLLLPSCGLYIWPSSPIFIHVNTLLDTPSIMDLCDPAWPLLGSFVPTIYSFHSNSSFYWWAALQFIYQLKYSGYCYFLLC